MDLQKDPEESQEVHSYPSPLGRRFLLPSAARLNDHLQIGSPYQKGRTRIFYPLWSVLLYFYFCERSNDSAWAEEAEVLAAGQSELEKEGKVQV
jgi:hypothetical protein